jgi:RNA polymerase sigma factor for flagellar operon FliA
MEIKDFMPWVRIIAQNIHRSLPASIMLNDLVQDGMIGLIIALREYNPSIGAPFQSFAVNKIKWAIMDGLRAGDWAEKSVRSRANKVTKTIEKLQGVLSRPPTNQEVATELGVRVSDVLAILGEVNGISFVRINDYQRLDDEQEGSTQDVKDSSLEPSSIVERRESYFRAIEYLKNLLPNERKAFILRNICEMSSRQTAVEMGLSESRVSQLYKTATEKIASNM